MRFLISVIDSSTRSGTAAELVEIDKFNDMLREKGHWIYACGLDYPNLATLIDGRVEPAELVAGPLHQGEQYLSGFWLVEAESEEVAKSLAAQGSRACNRRVELRPLL